MYRGNENEIEYCNNRGHEVKVTTFINFKDFIEEEGIEFAPLAGDAVEVIRLLIGENVSSFI